MGHRINSGSIHTTLWIVAKNNPTQQNKAAQAGLSSFYSQWETVCSLIATISFRVIPQGKKMLFVIGKDARTGLSPCDSLTIGVKSSKYLDIEVTVGQTEIP